MAMRLQQLMARGISACVVVFALGTLFPLNAESIEWLYDVEVSVASRTQASANDALHKAMQICLARVTGRVAVAESSVVTRALQDPAAYVHQYRFASIADRYGAENDVLVAQFDKELIQSLAKEARLPIWPADRPTILLWMSLRGRLQSEIAKAGTQLGELALQRARDRGIKLVLPLMDLADRMLINTSSVDGQFWLDIEQASKRYATDLVVAGSVKKNVFGEARLHMTTWIDGSAIYKVLEVDDESSAIQRGVGYIADLLADRYALSRDVQNVLRMRVFEIRTIKAYARLLKYIDEQEYIDSADVVSYSDGVLELDVHTPSPPDRIVTLIKPEGKLVPRLPSHEASVSLDELIFSWDGEK